MATYKKTDGLDTIWKKDAFKEIQRDDKELSKFIDNAMQVQMMSAMEIHRRTGLSYNSIESIRLGDHKIYYDKLIKVLNCLGYELIIREAF